ncbi:MAG: hypothetical protein AAGG06_03455 [Pseudomonadota bacterium]
MEPSLARIPETELVHYETVDGVEQIVSHLVYRNVLTDFDQKLSQHMAATKGEGFPVITVLTRVCARDGAAVWKQTGRSNHATIPHALKAIGERALGEAESATVLACSCEFGGEETDRSGVERVLSRTDLETLGRVLDNARSFGEYEFLDLSGDYTLVVVQPNGIDGNPVTMDIQCGTLSAAVSDGQGFEGPLWGFTQQITEDAGARAYLARVHHALSGAKEDAILAFRAAAEERIMSFDKALQGRPLEGFRLDAAMALVARLKAGFGDSLFGLSEAAQITALEWAASIAKEGGAPYSDSREVGAPMGAEIRPSAAAA